MAIQTESRKRRRKPVQRSANYYKDLRKELAVQGPVQVEYSPATERNLSGIWKRWILYSKDNNEEPVHFIKSANTADYKAFFSWLLDHYPGTRKKSSVSQYWRRLKLLYKNHTRKFLDKNLVDDVNNYIIVLTNMYGLDTSVRDKPVLSVDDLLLLQHYHWVLDKWVYPDEEQRLLLSLLFLFAAYTGCRPCSLVDASVKGSGKSAGTTVKDKAIRFYDSEDDEDDDDDEPDREHDKETDSDEDDLTLASTEELMSVLYEHVTIAAVKVQGRMQIVMFVTITHTKGEKRKPQPKTFRMYQNNNPLLCPIAHMIAVGLHNKAFAATTIHGPEDILRAQVPKRKNCLTFRWDESKLKEPIFREPRRSKSQKPQESAMPLRASTSGRYMKRLGRDVGMEQSLSHSCFRRGTGNAVDSAGTVGERDQVMGHSYSGIFQFYINPNVKCDVQAAYLNQPSDKALMKVLGNMSLTCDPLAPTRLSPDDARAIQQDSKVATLRKRRDSLSKALKKMRKDDEQFGDVQDKEQLLRLEKDKEQLLQLKTKADAALRKRKKRLHDHRLKDKREKYYLENDTRELEDGNGSLYQDEDKGENSSMTYPLKERSRVAAMMSRPPADLTESGNLDQRIDLIREMTKLCSRREARRRNMASSSGRLEVVAEDTVSLFSLPLECNPSQCLFCIGDERLPPEHRTFCWSRPAKMMDHIEDQHLKSLALDAKILCPHPRCRESEVMLDGVSHFKSHALRIHNIRLRVLKADCL